MKKLLAIGVLLLSSSQASAVSLDLTNFVLPKVDVTIEKGDETYFLYRTMILSGGKIIWDNVSTSTISNPKINRPENYCELSIGYVSQTGLQLGEKSIAQASYPIQFNINTVDFSEEQPGSFFYYGKPSDPTSRTISIVEATPFVQGYFFGNNSHPASDAHGAIYPSTLHSEANDVIYDSIICKSHMEKKESASSTIRQMIQDALGTTAIVNP